MPYSTYPFELPPLPYEYNALEPYIDEETMHYHHDKHFATYISNLNNALKEYPHLQTLTLEQLLTSPLPPEIRTTVLNNGGGVYNHMKFFENLSPPAENNHIPEGNLMTLIQQTYGSWDNFKTIFTDAALKVFGSGWVCLSLTNQCFLKIVTLANQETVLPCNSVPVILCDVWEHAYYLKYKNLRTDYVKNIWSVLKFPDTAKSVNSLCD